MDSTQHSTAQHMEPQHSERDADPGGTKEVASLIDRLWSDGDAALANRQSFPGLAGLAGLAAGGGERNGRAQQTENGTARCCSPQKWKEGSLSHNGGVIR